MSILFLKGNTCIHWLARSRKDNTSYIFQMIMDQLTRTKYRYHNDEISMGNHLKNFIDQLNDKKQTALMLAAKNNHQNLVKFLLDYDAAIDLKDDYNMSALDYSDQTSCAQLINSFRNIQLNKSNFVNRESEVTIISPVELDQNLNFS
jgi:ankyrin repeat protein